MPLKHSVLVTILLVLSPRAWSADWHPVTPEELALRQSKTDPNADAECLFRDVRIENSVEGYVHSVSTNYIRFKIFNDRGREKYSDVKIEYSEPARVSNVSARTIHPDGTIIEVKRDAIFDKVEVKKGDLKRRVVSFAFPSVEPGSIIEYRWKEDESEYLHRYIPLDVQTEYPVDRVTFHVKPAVDLPEMHVMNFHCDPEQGPPDSDGLRSFTFRNVRAYHPEPYSPPNRSAKQWVLVYYDENPNVGTDRFWPSVGKDANSKAKDQIKISSEMKQTAAQLVSQGKTDDEKLALIAEYCRKNIKNIDGSDISTQEREAYRPNANSSDTFRRKVGTAEDIDFVFIALAQAAHYDARSALVADRRNFLFKPDVQSAFFLNNSDAAVQIDGKWKFFDVSDTFVPPGTLTWPEQGVYALVPDGKNSQWVQTPLLTSDQSKLERTADLGLSATGDVEGKIQELYWGNFSIQWRIDHANQNDPEVEASIRRTLKERFADFNVTGIKVALPADVSGPVSVTYDLSVKGYAQSSGKRMFLHPSFFSAGQPIYFTDADRTNAIYFDYPWSESETVNIHLPTGFDLDHPDSPGSFQFPPIGKYAADISIANATLAYRRSFVFGSDKIPQFDRQNYDAIKAVFEQIHSADEHMITLKQAASQK